ncbi:energy transducer TonB [Thauera sinica]|nr:energy transducer TonB [Thauera sp. K11]
MAAHAAFLPALAQAVREAPPPRERPPAAMRVVLLPELEAQLPAPPEAGDGRVASVPAAMPPVRQEAPAQPRRAAARRPAAAPSPPRPEAARPAAPAVEAAAGLPRPPVEAAAGTQPASQPLAPQAAASSPAPSAVPETPPVREAHPDYAYNPAPAYPPLLQEQGIGGVVWLRVWVDGDGRPREIRLAKGSGYRLLDDAALRAVRNWRFIPARRGDEPLASWVEFPIRFTVSG